jgi:hypothetical protein
MVWGGSNLILFFHYAFSVVGIIKCVMDEFVIYIG